jgi:hypothetical protein
MKNNGRRYGIGMDAELREAFGDDFDVWPEKHQRYNFHPWHDCQRIAAEFESEQDIARDFLLPQHKALGAERDDPGALAIYEKHRIVERQIADKLYCDVTAYAQSAQREILAGQIRATAIKMFQCRTAGNFGMGPQGRPVIAWESKCGCSKLCPDEARHEGQRLFDRYASVMAEHEKHGGRVYKMWLTLPNYPGARLAEGQRYIFKRFRDRMIRPVSKGKNKFGIDGALAILEAPLSKDREWNVHLNVVLLTKGWISYAKLRDAWGWNLEVRHHRRFDEKGMHALFNEMVKYSVRTVTEKSGSKHHSEAPAFIDWTPAEILEWFEANQNFRRTRAYGCLHGIGKPDRPENRPARWLGMLTWHPDGYRITWRGHNLAHTANELLKAGHGALDLIRGDRSTAQRQVKTATGPP